MCCFSLAQKPKADDRENSAKSKIGGIGGRLGDDQSNCAEDIARLCPEIREWSLNAQASDLDSSTTSSV